MAKERKSVEKRLVEVLMSENRNVLKEVGKSLNYSAARRPLDYTLSYQRVLSRLAGDVSSGEATQKQLGEIISICAIETIKRDISAEFRKISAEQYYELRNSGKTHQNIVAEYPEQKMHLRGLAGNYAKYGPELKNQGKYKRAIRSKPKLTLEKYSTARGRGLTNEQIKERYNMDSPYQICGFARAYLSRKTEKTKGEEDRRKPEMTGDLYRKFFRQNFGRLNPRNVESEVLRAFDMNILNSYTVPHRKNSLRVYRAWFNYPGKYKKK